uniref:Uncharacterized protein n=1 Tax=Aureoumbra lagunensis TaxID=44058 RepID=A0A7S3NH82_9STRA
MTMMVMVMNINHPMMKLMKKKKKVSRELSVQDSIGFLQTLNTITSLANTVTQAATSAKKYVMHSLDERDEEDVPRFPIIRYLVVGDAIEINAHNDDDDDNDRKLNGKEICDVERERESSTKEISKPSKNYTNPAERLTNDRDSTSTVERRSSFNTSFKRKKKRDSSCQPKVIAQKSKKKITASSDDIDLHRPSQFGLQSYDDALALTDFVSAFVEMLQSGFRLVQHESPDKPAYLIILSLSSDCSNLCWNICASSNKYNNDNQQHQLFVQNFGSSSQRTKRRIADARVLNDPPKFKLRRPTSNCFALTFSPKSERVAGLAPREIYVFESKNADTKALLVDGLNLLLDKALYKFFNSSNTFRIPKKMNSNSTTSESAKKVTSSPKNTVDDDANKSTSHNSAKTPPVSLISANSGTKDVEAISPHFSLTSSSSAKEQRQGLETPKLLDNNISSKPTVFLFQQKVEDKTPSIDIYVSSSTTS